MPKEEESSWDSSQPRDVIGDRAAIRTGSRSLRRLRQRQDPGRFGQELLLVELLKQGLRQAASRGPVVEGAACATACATRFRRLAEEVRQWWRH